MSEGQPDLTPYEIAYLAGGPARVADTAIVELLRRRQLKIWPTGLLAPVDADRQALADARGTVADLPGRPGTVAGLPGRPGTVAGRPGMMAAADSTGQRLEQLILGLASAPGGIYLPAMRRRCASWPPVRQLGSRLAAARLIFGRRQRRSALAVALVLLAAGVAAGLAFANGWQIAPTARSPLGVAAAVVVAGLLARAAKRMTGSGREVLEDTGLLTRQMLAHLQRTVPAAGTPQAAGTPAAADGDSPALTAQEIANVALTGLSAVRDAELRVRLSRSAPRHQPVPTADKTLASSLDSSSAAR
jgi:hypothetical protein